MIPGRALHRIAACICDARSMEHVVEPAIAEFQHECRHARGAGRQIRSLWLGYAALVKVIAMSAGRDRDRMLLNGGIIRGLLWGVGAALCAAAAVTTSVFLVFGLEFHGFRPIQALFGIPLIVPIALPVGFIVGIAFGVGPAELSRRASRNLAVVAVVASMTSMVSILSVGALSRTAFATMRGGSSTSQSTLEVWRSEMRPASLFRTAVTTFRDRSINRTTWGLHMRWSMSIAPIMLLMFTFALKARWPSASRAAILAACAGYLLLFALGDKLFMDYRHVPLLPLAWMPNMVLMAATLAILAVRLRKTSLAVRS